jgi:hypothetical protein
MPQSESDVGSESGEVDRMIMNASMIMMMI